MLEKYKKPEAPSRNRFPGYDVLSKHSTPSWNDKTREVVARRLAIGDAPKFFSAEEFLTLRAAAARIVPQLRAWSTRSCIKGNRTDIGTPGCRARPRRGGSASRR
jgi:hypothetical protein